MIVICDNHIFIVQATRVVKMVRHTGEREYRM
jgi:hypothetical protein